MESWKIATLFAAVLYGLHNVFTKSAAGKITDQFGGLVLESTGALLILGYVILLGFKGTNSFDFTRDGILFSILAGVCVGAGTVLYFAIFRLGGDLSIAGPAVLVGGVLIMSAVGIIIFKEGVSFSKGLGLALGVSSVYILSARV